MSAKAALPLALGPDWQQALWPSPYRLRSELSIGDDRISKFTSAFDRARTLARAALPGESVTAIVAGCPNPGDEANAARLGWGKRKAFDILADMGVHTEDAKAVWEGFAYPNAEQNPKFGPWEHFSLEHRALSISWDKADILLWNSIAQDMGILPRAPVISWLIDPERGVLVFAYDDRGMDITSLEPEPTLDLYQRFDSWLLDYDRPRMEMAFD